jgi:hypothetical protein
MARRVHMSLDREAIVATAEPAYALVWRALAADIPGKVASAVRPGVMQQISAARADLHVIDEEVLGSLRTASGSHG